MIDSVVTRLKSGKEADLFVVERTPYHYVAKVYKEKRFRSFKNDAGYREGRSVRNTRAQRALSKNTKFGKKLAEEAWHNAEVNALRTLELAGARVPRILAHHERVLIMEMICDEHGQLAPQLAEVPLDAAGAREMYDTIMSQVVLMLLNDLVHGDLSPYNVLIGTNGPVIIDMPQCVSAAHNRQANRLLERDVWAITRHLGLIDPGIRALGKHAWQLWVEYERGTLTADFRPDPERKKATQVGDLSGLVDFVHAAKEEGELERRAAEGDADARALLRAADRRAARRARKVEEAKLAAAEEAKKALEKTKQKTRRKTERKTQKKGPRSSQRVAKKSQRRKRADSAPRKKAETGQTPDKPKGRRRRRRRRGRGKGGSKGAA